jgi:hypothetical protein
LILWVILFVACMIWARFGVGGLETAAVVGAMFMAGAGVRSFLNAYWRRRDSSDITAPKMSFWTRSSNNKYRQGLFRTHGEHFRSDFR